MCILECVCGSGGVSSASRGAPGGSQGVGVWVRSRRVLVQECGSTCISGGVCASVMCILVHVCAYVNVCSTKVKSASFGKKHRTLGIFRTELLVALLFSHTKGIVGLFASEQHPDRLSGTLGMHHKHSRPSQSPAQVGYPAGNSPSLCACRGRSPALASGNLASGRLLDALGSAFLVERWK